MLTLFPQSEPMAIYLLESLLGPETVHRAPEQKIGAKGQDKNQSATGEESPSCGNRNCFLEFIPQARGPKAHRAFFLPPNASLPSPTTGDWPKDDHERKSFSSSIRKGDCFIALGNICFLIFKWVPPSQESKGSMEKGQENHSFREKKF